MRPNGALSIGVLILFLLSTTLSVADNNTVVSNFTTGIQNSFTVTAGVTATICACPATSEPLVDKPNNESVGSRQCLSNANTNWWAPIAAVLVVGSAGFLVVFSVRWLTRKRYYDYIQQFLIALAVGSLCGDAMLHLIPHALMSELHMDEVCDTNETSIPDHDHDHDHDHHHGDVNSHAEQHSAAIWKALAGTMGIYMFLLVNRISEFIHIMTHSEDKTVPIPPLRTPTMNCKNKKTRRCSHECDNTHSEAQNQVDQKVEADGGEDNDHHHHYHPPHHPAQLTGASFQCAQRTCTDQTVVFKTAANKMVSCNGQIDEEDGRCAIELMTDGEKQKMNAEAGCSECKVNVNEDGQASSENTDSTVLTSGKNAAARAPAITADDSKQMLMCDEKLSFDSDEDTTGPSTQQVQQPPQERHYVDMIASGHASAMRQTHHSYHHQTEPSHGHHHHHHHHAATSLRSIVWTVVLGDGLHNFCDGLVIGAQFALSLHGGLSTSIAVFCHELPHELGDFAMLIHCGMKRRTALICNAISAVICFFGMVTGMMLGAIHNVSSWIYMLTAGMFFYIALAAMMPELISVFPNRKSKRSMAMLFVAQNAGILIGGGIMLVIALFEDKFNQLLSK